MIKKSVKEGGSADLPVSGKNSIKKAHLVVIVDRISENLVRVHCWYKNGSPIGNVYKLHRREVLVKGIVLDLRSVYVEEHLHLFLYRRKVLNLC